jgi:CII-binding regulator of phage lambda lysogenization HflD
MLKMVEGMELTDEEMYHMVEDYGWGRDTEERGFVLSVMDITSKAQLLKSQQHYEARIKELQHQLKRGCVDCEDALKAEAKAEAYKEIISEMKSRYKPLNGEVKQCDDCAAFILEVIKLKSGKPQEGE